jgi:hypothetical protein
VGRAVATVAATRFRETRDRPEPLMLASHRLQIQWQLGFSIQRAAILNEYISTGVPEAVVTLLSLNAPQSRHQPAFTLPPVPSMSPRSDRHQQNQRNLVTVTVGPGSETGLYYVVIANVRGHILLDRLARA